MNDSSQDDHHPEALARSLRMALQSYAKQGVGWISVDPNLGELAKLTRELKSGGVAQAQSSGPKRTPVKSAPIVTNEGAGPRPRAASAAPSVAKRMPVNVPSQSALELAKYGGARAEKLAALAAKVANCEACGLCETRTQTVYSRGNPNSPLMLIGEAPGADEDSEGLPFVGRAGKLMDDIIVKGMKYDRDSVYVANVLKCRPPNNRNPEPSEIEACRDYLFEQIAIVDPIVIIALGRFPAQWLLESTEPIGKLRGKIWDKNGRHILCTYHPAYLLRNPSAKAAVWADVQLVMEFFGRDKPLPMRG